VVDGELAELVEDLVEEDLGLLPGQERAQAVADAA